MLKAANPQLQAAKGKIKTIQCKLNNKKKGKNKLRSKSSKTFDKKRTMLVQTKRSKTLFKIAKMLAKSGGIIAKNQK